MNSLEEYQIKKYRMSESEIEDFNERMGMMVDDSGEDEIESIKLSTKIMLRKRKERNNELRR